MKKLYKLYRKNYCSDEFDAKVLIADSEDEARTIANFCTGDEGKIWHRVDLALCKEINLNEIKGSYELLGSFNCG